MLELKDNENKSLEYFLPLQTAVHAWHNYKENLVIPFNKHYLYFNI